MTFQIKGPGLWLIKVQFCLQKGVPERKILFIHLDISITRVPVLDSFCILRGKKWSIPNTVDNSCGKKKVKGQ